MYYAILRLVMDPETSYGHDRKSVASLSHKIQDRFGAKCRGYKNMEEDGEMQIVIALLEPSEAKILGKLSEIKDYLEKHGIGRIESENLLMDHVDTIYSVNV